LSSFEKLHHEGRTQKKWGKSKPSYTKKKRKISKEVYKKCKGAPKHIRSIQKGHQNRKKEGREEKHPQNQNTPT